MKFYLCKTKPDNGRIFMSRNKPEKKVLENGEIHWTFNKTPLQTDPNAMHGLGVYADRIPGPGEFREIVISDLPKTITEALGD